MRQYIQLHRAAYTFIGSRRRILLDIFNEKRRPFYKSTINFELPPLPKPEFSKFVSDLFSSHGKTCEIDAASRLVDSVDSFPYYTQKLAYFVFDSIADSVKIPDIEKGMRMLLKDESPSFEGILLGLAPRQIALLAAIASEPGRSIFSQEYMQRHRLGSIGGAQAAKKKLLKLDLIEQDANNWKVVDPVFAKWLVQR